MLIDQITLRMQGSTAIVTTGRTTPVSTSYPHSPDLPMTVAKAFTNFLSGMPEGYTSKVVEARQDLYQVEIHKE